MPEGSCWVRVEIDGHQAILRVLADEPDLAVRHVESAFAAGQRIEHTTPGGPLVVEWGRVASLRVLGPLSTSG